ncbi:4a-hydroxytetrahydrobiopterin dehydratase [Variovorax rhizosphaerae]|uniref:4a-hydroxytetrahydrobiopterin dehydratase n=1 Tax=Variovorax rhizosphaerae TaxID=1836200 RepID=A0ABU8WM97_9BURK
MTKVFISYRRQDSGTAARQIAADFGVRYGEGDVFMDTDSIRVGSDWTQEIEKALRAASVVLAIIGPKWIHTHDEYGRRRIDNDADWVRNEIVHGLANNKQVIPLLVQGAPQLEEDALPDALKPLCKIQNYEISQKYWPRDVKFFFEELERAKVLPRSLGSQMAHPPKRDISVPLSDEESSNSIDPGSGWTIRKSMRPVETGTQLMNELTKAYVFQTFEDCIHFMNTAARHISFIDHHPRWENVWVNLIVSLTSLDIGGELTYKDIRLAKYLDELFIAYKKKSEA